MSTSRLQRTIQHYRQQLLQQEAEAEDALNTAYTHVLKSIQPALDKLYDQMVSAMAGGEKIPLNWLVESQRLENIKKLIASQFDHYGNLTQLQVGQLQHMAVTLGQEAAQALLQSTVPVGVSWTFGVPSLEALKDLIGATQAGSPLADLFSGFGAEAARNTGNALVRGLAMGNNPRQVARDVQQALGVSRNRALTISRNEMNRAYRGSNMETYRANSDVVGQWRWTCSLSARSCAACIFQDGTLHDLDEELDEHCCGRCTPVPVTKSWEDILGGLGIDTSDIENTSPIDDMPRGSDWFYEQDEATQIQILGTKKYNAWQNGDFQLEDIVGHSHDDTWGDSIYEKSLKELVNA